MKQTYWVIVMTTDTGVAVFGNSKGEPFASVDNANRSKTMRTRKAPHDARMFVREVRP